MNRDYDIAIVGGGASGMIAAITAAQYNPSLKIAILEKNARVGKKLLATGNGRCNLTNLDQNPDHYHGKNKWFIQQVLDQFNLDATLDFFRSIGVETISENGKIFPYSLQAASVLDLLRHRLKSLHVAEVCDFSCTSIKKDGDTFFLTAEDGGRFSAGAVLVATGGKASPQTGSTGDGYRFLEEFGHRCTELAPALVQVRVHNKKTLPLKGIKVQALVSAIENGRTLRDESGEVLFTEYGLSGPPIFQLSRFAAEATQKKTDLSFVLDLFPNVSCDDLEQALIERQKILPSDLLLVGLLHKVVGREIFRELGGHVDNMRKLALLLKSWSFPVNGTQGWGQAQVTTGGIELGGFSPLSLESKHVRGLFACGEVLDVDGDCGGYNLQWAWSSGVVAGRALSKR